MGLLQRLLLLRLLLRLGVAPVGTFLPSPQAPWRYL